MHIEEPETIDCPNPECPGRGDGLLMKNSDGEWLPCMLCGHEMLCEDKTEPEYWRVDELIWQDESGVIHRRQFKIVNQDQT